MVSTCLKPKPKGSPIIYSRFRLKVAVKLRQHFFNKWKFHALVLEHLSCSLASHQLFKINVVHSGTIVFDFKPESLLFFVVVCCYSDATSFSFGQTKLYQPDDHLLYTLAVAPQLQIRVYSYKICPDLDLRFLY